jgi:hypothetical protein
LITRKLRNFSSSAPKLKLGRKVLDSQAIEASFLPRWIAKLTIRVSSHMLKVRGTMNSCLVWADGLTTFNATKIKHLNWATLSDVPKLDSRIHAHHVAI